MATELEKKITKVLLLSKNRTEYLRKVTTEHPLKQSLYEIFNDVQIDDLNNLPRLELFINHSNYQDKKLKIEYQTRIRLSKLVNVIKLSFHCTVLNPDPNAYEKRIETESLFECYNNEQVEIEEKIRIWCDEHKISILTHSDENFVIPKLDLVHSGMNFFGNQPNVGMLFFEDFFDFFPEN